MGDDSDFFGGVLRFVGGALTLLFGSQTRRAASSIWTDDQAVDVPLDLTLGQPAAAAPVPSMQQRVHDEVAALAQVDPDFSELRFLEQSTAVYLAYVAADAALDADAMSAFATPDFVETYRKTAADLRMSGLRRVAHDVKVLGSAIIKASLDGTRQAIIARFVSSGVRFTQDVDSGAATDGSAQADSFTEFATFVRPPNTTTPKAATAGGATHCPSCGAPTTAGDAACPYCGTQLTGTGSQWRLDKISASAYT